MKLQKKHIPNILTIIRMIIVPVIVVFLLVPFGPTIYSIVASNSISFNSVFRLNFFLAGILFLLASLTDWLDGYLARKNHWITNFGKLWDPISDKVLINSILICFAFNGLVPVWIPIIMIARDVVVDASRMHASSKGNVVAANIYGKLKTIAQMVGVIFIFFLFDCTSNNTIQYWAIQNLMMYIALGLSVISGIIYIYSIYRKPRQGK